MKIMRKEAGKLSVKISKSEWESIGKEAGWFGKKEKEESKNNHQNQNSHLFGPSMRIQMVAKQYQKEHGVDFETALNQVKNMSPKEFAIRMQSLKNGSIYPVMV